MTAPLRVNGNEVAPTAVEAIEGQPVHGGALHVKPLLHGEHMMCFRVDYAPGVGAPLHVHDHESIIYVISGRVRTRVGDDEYVLGPGEACRHPSGVAHSVEAIEASVMFEVKSPAPEMQALFDADPVSPAST